MAAAVLQRQKLVLALVELGVADRGDLKTLREGIRWRLVV